MYYQQASFIGIPAVMSLYKVFSSKLKQFQRMRSFLNVKAAVLVYKSMLLPILEYGDVFLSAASAADRKKLQVLQNRGLRCALNKGIETSSDSLHTEAGILKLKYRREQHLLNFMYDWSLDPCKVKKNGGARAKTRSHTKRLLKTKRPRTEKYKKCLSYTGPSLWNNLSAELHQLTSKAVFKSQIGVYIKQKSID